MNTMNESLAAWVDREKIRDCVARIARGEDRRDAELLRACYWPDAAVDFGIFSGDFEKYLAWVVPGSPAVRLTQHVLGQTLIELNGDAALTETHVMSYHRIDMGPEERDLIIGGRYLDRLERRNTAWRVLERTLVYDWCQDFGKSADWSRGLMGTAFSAEHFSGRAVGDFSQTLFGAFGHVATRSTRSRDHAITR